MTEKEKKMRRITRRSLVGMIGGLLAAVWSPKLWARRESGLYERNAMVEGVPGTEYAPSNNLSVYEALKKRSRFKAFHGGCVAGKTHAFAEEMIRRAESRLTRAVCVWPVPQPPYHRNPTQQVVDGKAVSANWSSRGRWWSPEGDLDWESIYGENGSEIRFINVWNCTVGLLHFGDIVWVDNADSLRETTLRYIVENTRPDAELWFTWNPQWPHDSIDQFFRSDEVPSGAIIRPVTWRDNKFLELGDLNRIVEDRERLSPQEYLHRWEGHYMLPDRAQYDSPGTVLAPRKSEKASRPRIWIPGLRR